MAKNKIKSRRDTSQRQLIFNYLKQTKSHPTAEQIYRQIKKNLPYISLATVYRNLKVLSEQGKISSITYSKDYTHYESLTDNHYHFVCEKCDKIEHISLSEMVDINCQVAKRHGFKIKKHQLIFWGLCRDCLKLEK